ncbi:uncharacterized protein [Diadema antillarum]|uniref:uncharacterized protein n=1 Tax=Diadema antillarum TaxID=105358 RepID=UPI003A843561
MATNFRNDDDTDCEGCHIKTKSHITYRREVHERLCDDCAREREESIKEVVRRVKYFCGKHNNDEAKLYCKDHEIPVCDTCAFDPNHKACQMHDIHEVKTEKQSQVRDLLHQGQAKKENIACQEEDVGQHLSNINIHLEMIERQVKEKEDEERKKIQDKLDKETARINREADENIRKINEQRKKRLQQATNAANQANHKGQNNAESLIHELRKIKGIIEKYTVKLQSELQGKRVEISGAIKKAEDLIIEEERLLRDVSDVTSLLNHCIKTNVNLENISQIRQKVERIKFQKKQGLEIGKLDGMDDEECVLHDAWKQPVGTKFLGLICKHEVMLNRGNSLFVANTKSRTITPVKIPGIDQVKYLSIARLDEDRLVAGPEDGSLRILYRHSTYRDHNVEITWRHVRTILTKCGPYMFLSVTKNGLILAALKYGSTIDVYDPENGKLVQKVGLREGIEICGLSSLSSGSIVVMPMIGSNKVLYVLDQVMSTIRLPPFSVMFSYRCSIAIDESDDIYFMHYDIAKRLYVVDVLSTTGAMISEAIIECPEPPLLAMALPKRLTVFHDLTIYSYERKSFMDFVNALK